MERLNAAPPFAGVPVATGQSEWRSPEWRSLGQVDYQPAVDRMRAFTDARGKDTADEFWVLQHPPVFTQGQAGRAEHVLSPGGIPVVQADRGGQVTYHGPGQLVIYCMIDLQRAGYGIRSLVTRIEQALVQLLAGYGIAARGDRDAPGVYVDDRLRGPAKIASLGLRVRRGCSYHGLALNVNMDLEPFSRINPCGHAGLRMTQLAELGVTHDVARVAEDLRPQLLRELAPASPPTG